MALEKEDLKQIREIVTEVVDKKIDSFAIVVAKSFVKVDERFDQIDKRFERVEYKIGLLQTDVKAIQREIDDIKNKLAAIEKRTFQDTDLSLKELEKIKKRVTYLEKILKVKTA